MVTEIRKAYVRKYRDSGQVTAYVEWVDAKGKAGRTEGQVDNLQMQALLSRAKREGIQIERQTW